MFDGPPEGPMAICAEQPRRVSAGLSAFAIGVLLAIAPAAQAGWSAPRAIRSAVPGAFALSSPSVALGGGSRGSIIAQRATPEGTGAIAQGFVRRARVSRLTDVLAGIAVSYAPSPSGGAAIAVQSPSGVAGYFRDPRATIGAPIALGPLSTQILTATNGRGDAVLATVAPGNAGSVALVVRPARGAPSAVVVSDPGQIALGDVAISARGHVAVTWSRGGVLEGRVREPTGALSPVGQLTPAGTQILDAAIAVDGRGVTDLAAVIPAPAVPGPAAAVITARRPAGGAFSGPAVLDTGPQIDSLEAEAAGRGGLVSWLRTGLGPPPALIPVPRIHAAARQGGGALRRVDVKTARGGAATVSDPRPALAPDGSAVIASSFGGAVHVARRPPGRRAFPRPRVISTLSGGTQAFSQGNRTVAAANGGRALVAWADREGQPRLSAFLPRTRDRSGRERSRPPRLRATPPLLDLNTAPATIRSNVACNQPCRVTVIIRVRGSSTVIVRARRVLPRGRRASIAQQISTSQDRRIRRGEIRSIYTTVTAANGYGALVTRLRRLL